MPVMRLGNTIRDSYMLAEAVTERMFGFIDLPFTFLICFTYGEIQSALTMHVARKAALQRMFVHYQHESVGRFAGYVMDAFYEQGSNTRFHVMQLFEDRLCACYGYEPFQPAASYVRNNRVAAIFPSLVKCQCASKSVLHAIPCRCGEAQVPY